MIPLSLRAALRHLTVLPLHYDEREATIMPNRVLTWFPLVGLVVAIPVFLCQLLPVAPLPRAALALLVWTVVTGNLHEDGLCDIADAALAPVPLERRHEILKDPRVGAHAVSAAILFALLRFSLLSATPASAVLLAAPVGRYVMVLALATVPPARDTGLAARFSRNAQWIPATVLLIFVLAASMYFLGWTAVPISAAAVAAGYGAVIYISLRLGGLTGDVCGAAGIITETAALAMVGLVAR